MCKKLYMLVAALVTCISAHGMFESIGKELDAIHQRMEFVFEEFSQKTRATRIVAPDYDIHVEQERGAITISIKLSKTVTPDDITVEVDDNVLEVVVDSDDMVELKLVDQDLSIVAKRILEKERVDENGAVYAVSSGSAHMSQSLRLPARVDLTKPVKADLTDGVLTLTLTKKGPQKITVTTSESAHHEHVELEEEPTIQPVEPDVEAESCSEEDDIEKLK